MSSHLIAELIEVGLQPKQRNVLRFDHDNATIFCGPHVLVTDRRGFVGAKTQGYYFEQTRFLSRFEVSSPHAPVKPICWTTSDAHSSACYFLLRSPAGRIGAPPGDEDAGGGEIVENGIEIQINTFIGGGFHQDVYISNRALAPAEIILDWSFDADFADFAEADSATRPQYAPVRRSFVLHGPGAGELRFEYQHPRLNHATRIRLLTPGPLSDRGHSLRTRVTLERGGTRSIRIDVIPAFLGDSIEPWFGVDGEPLSRHDVADCVREWLFSCAEFRTPCRAVQAACERAASDLSALHSMRGVGDERFTPMAGIPKFTALFGRDTLMAGVQSAILTPRTLNGALSSVGAWTATERDDRFDAQPGKVLHQRQLSPLALLEENPFRHYYGDYSASGLFALGAAWRFAHTGDRSEFGAVEDKILATLAWMDRDGDLDGDGFYEYRTLAGDKGTKNQGWKDSNQAILYSDGGFVRNPIAVAEIQGLFYAAKQAAALAFWIVGRHELAQRLLAEACALKRRFNERFWMEEERFFALALDPDKNPVRTIASNAAVCLAYGIIDEPKAAAVAERVLAPDMFSGWGVRTLSCDHPAFNPFGYHLGTVWPVANANICFGLRRYGFFGELHRLAKAIFDATENFDFNRLPECFSGHARSKRNPHPGIYPEACSPQAWSASAIIHIMGALAGIVPLAPLRTLVVDPSLPDWMPELVIRRLAVGGESVSLRFVREANGFTRWEALEGGEGLRIIGPEYFPGLSRGCDRIAAALMAAVRESA